MNQIGLGSLALRIFGGLIFAAHGAQKLLGGAIAADDCDPESLYLRGRPGRL